MIRPLLGCAEADLAAYALAHRVPILPCNLCGNQPNSQRQQVKRLLASLEGQIPDLRRSLAAAVGNVEPEHLLDTRLAGATSDGASMHDDEPRDLVQLRSMHMRDSTR